MLKTLIVVLGLAGLAAAQTNHQTPFTGTWTFNADKSAFNPGPPFKRFTLTFTPDGVRHLDLVPANGQAFKAELPWSDGKEVAVVVKEGSMPNAKAAPEIRGRTFNDTWTQDGKVIEKVHGVVSRDGKTLAVTVKGHSSVGPSITAWSLTSSRSQTSESSGFGNISAPTGRERPDTKGDQSNMSTLTPEEIRSVSPALERYRQERLAVIFGSGQGCQRATAASLQWPS